MAHLLAASRRSKHPASVPSPRVVACTLELPRGACGTVSSPGEKEQSAGPGDLPARGTLSILFYI